MFVNTHLITLLFNLTFKELDITQVKLVAVDNYSS